VTWRPRNESAGDVEREALILDAFCDAMSYARWIKLSESLYEIDAACFDSLDALMAWAEAKSRTKLYDHVLLSAAKALQLYRLHLATHVPAWFVIHVPGHGVMVHRIRAPHDYRIALAGNDRGQNGDKEPCIFIDHSAFSIIAPPLWE